MPIRDEESGAYLPSKATAAALGKPVQPECHCYNGLQATLCMTGHILECHYPLSCEQAQCDHYLVALQNQHGDE